MTVSRARISWTFPAPVILAIVGQAVALGWVGSKQFSSLESTIHILETRVTAVEATAANNLQMIERVKGVEVNVEVLKAQSQNIESKIDKLIDRGMK